MAGPRLQYRDYPSQDNENLGCEDPKVYAANGRYFMFYNGICTMDGTEETVGSATVAPAAGNVACDIYVAVSADMIRWEKLGLAVPHDISQYWAKGAVIPRSERGEAVKIKGEYLMHLSEVCGGITHAGQSTDMVNWSFAAQEHLDIGNLNGSLHEVSCAIIGDDGSLVLDFFYRDATNQFAAAQALYDVYSPSTQKALNAGGSLACGGLLKYQGTWLFAQGWDAPRGSREMYFYRAG